MLEDESVASTRIGRFSPRELIQAGEEWLRGSPIGYAILTVIVGAAAGLGAVAFRWLIFSVTWLVTGHNEFGQQGRVASLHFPGVGYWFLLFIPVLGGVVYGPLIDRFAPEARGHGVPEVMIAVAENGGRIRPQVSFVKALASAICIGTGGSVGRGGPIVQIGSSLASSLGQVVRISESRLRILVACGAAGGIAATFNAPITGVFFGFELIFREFSVFALFATILSATVADLVSRAAFGSAPFFSGVPHGLSLAHAESYLLIALLGILAGLIGVGFKTVLYRIEDVADGLWGDRPQWLRPIVGGVILGAVLLALPQMYGVGYPVMNRVISGHEVLWFVAILMFAKMFTSSLTIAIGGSGGVFAPSLFTGAMAGMVFGEVVHHLFGPIVGDPAIYGMVAMGSVFAAASQAPLTSIASVVEMTGNFGLALPVMLAVGLAAGISKYMTYGTIYTTKLLRRGTDIDRPRPANALQLLTVAEVMQPLYELRLELSPVKVAGDHVAHRTVGGKALDLPGAGPIVAVRAPQALLAGETLEAALRQLALYGPDGLPVVGNDRRRVVGWVTNADVFRALADRVQATAEEAQSGAMATAFAGEKPPQLSGPPDPLPGYEVLEVPITEGVSANGQPLDTLAWPSGWIPVAIVSGRRTRAATKGSIIQYGERVVLLAPLESDDGAKVITEDAIAPTE